ncbi:epimerase [Microbacterium sp. P07]|uniref:epimerase n=1 Tax=Microbacterium sp. P07 TaxID=3366952 RepID=UPI003744D0DC
MTRRAVVAGGSGFIGEAVIAWLRDEGYSLTRVGRRGPDVSWDDTPGLRRAVDGAELLVNLAGKSVACRYTDANRDEILRSRVETTRALREAVAAAASPPAIWMNASTATIYRYALDHPQTDSGGDLGAGFSVDVARAWEAELFDGDLPGTRRVALRMAIVLGDGPATSMLLRLARLGLGGPQYDGPWLPHRRYRGIGNNPTGDGRAPWHRSRGRQRFSWIHIDDVVAAMRFIRDTPTFSGTVNLSSPNPTDNRTLMATLRRAVGAPIGLPAGRFILEPAMWALRVESELLLKSRWVVPERLLHEGFVFHYPELEPAVREIASR